jgi:hypothetical protein
VKDAFRPSSPPAPGQPAVAIRVTRSRCPADRDVSVTGGAARAAAVLAVAITLALD